MEHRRAVGGGFVPTQNASASTENEPTMGEKVGNGICAYPQLHVQS